ncbi:MAG TPA: prepilin-type N-terminal cleavage/methylation domain-containing protein [Gammaproteobacteria bacterium]
MTQPSRQIRSSGGFTLIELLVGSTVLCMVLTVLFSALWFAVRSWDAVERRRDATHTLALVQDTLARQLRQTRPLLHNDSAGQQVIAFRGDTHRISYIAPLSRRDSALYLNTLFVSETPQGNALRLRYQPWRPDLTMNSADSTDPQADDSIELLPDIQGLDIAYFGVLEAGGGPEWQARWPHAHHLPERIQVRIASGDAAAHDWPALIICLDGGADCLVTAAHRPDLRAMTAGGHADDR